MFELSEFDGLRHAIKEENNEFKRHLLLANIPANYHSFNFDHVIDIWSNDVANDEPIENYILYYKNLEKARNNGTGLFLSGTHGLAKTTAATVILLEAIRQKFTAYFISMTDLVDFITSGWKDYNLKLKYQYIVTNVDFLVVDDIGRDYHVQSSQSTQFLDKLFVTRCNQKKVTILTSMHDITSSSTIFNDSLVTLLKSNLIEIKLIGSDIRQEQSKVLLQQLSHTGKKGHRIG
jgi:DNA replication protein DnaC